MQRFKRLTTTQNNYVVINDGTGTRNSGFGYSQFNGEIYGYEEEDPAEHSDGIYLVPSEALSELSIETLTVIRHASIIITDDSSCDFDQFMQFCK